MVIEGKYAVEQFQVDAFKAINDILDLCKTKKDIVKNRETIIRMVAVAGGYCADNDCDKYCPLKCKDRSIGCIQGIIK